MIIKKLNDRKLYENQTKENINYSNYNNYHHKASLAENYNKHLILIVIIQRENFNNLAIEAKNNYEIHVTTFSNISTNYHKIYNSSINYLKIQNELLYKLKLKFTPRIIRIFNGKCRSKIFKWIYLFFLNLKGY